MFAVLSGQNIKSQTKPSVLLRRGQASNPIFALEVGHLSLMQPKQRGACYFDIYYVNLPFKDVDVQFGSNSHYKLLLLFMLCQFLASTVNTPASDVRVWWCQIFFWKPFGELVVKCRLPLRSMKGQQHQVLTMPGGFGALVTVSHMYNMPGW